MTKICARQACMSVLFIIFFAQTLFSQTGGSGRQTTENLKKSIGIHFGGGVVFWTNNDESHGLIAAPADTPGKGLPWNPGAEKVTGASASEVFKGDSNTEVIVSAQGVSSSYAARYCHDLSITDKGVTYNDWYLPCRHELNLMFRNRDAIGGFNTNNGIYWSSTESTGFPGTMAWEQEFKYGTQLEDDKDLPNQVRCIRKF